ncbi:MAG: dTDP-4-dehydrorhamnose 3,5-epimerase, partial [Solirubrobacteraceae bacterium]|nr:dTDP-4-dehydrorhamnose 3,5-epimerase [Solirubrobacteraceae bacterium]
VAIDWPFPADERLLSERDLNAPTLADVADSFDFA